MQSCVVQVCALILLLAFTAHAADVIPAGRKTTAWTTAGLPNGVPPDAGLYTNITTANTLAHLNTAIANLASTASNKYILMSTGIHSYNGVVDIPALRGVRIRGTLLGTNSLADRTDPNKSTIIRFTAGTFDGNFRFMGSENGDMSSMPIAGQSRNWTATYTQGSTTITLASAPTGLDVGEIMHLTQSNNYHWVRGNLGEGCDYCGLFATVNEGSNAWSMAQGVIVTGISGADVTFTPGLMMTNWNDVSTPLAYWRDSPTMWSGLENLTISNTTAGSHCTIGFRQAAYGWVTNCFIFDGARSHIKTTVAHGIEIRNNYFKGTQSAASQSYGVEIEASYQLRIEDNIFEGVTSPVVIGYSSAGNVIAYNFTTNHVYQSNPDYQQSMNSHAGHNCMNLIEGNWNIRWYGDAIHGSGSHNTIFRNRMIGHDNDNDEETSTIYFEYYNLYHNVVANILGEQGYHNNYLTTNSASESTSIYRIGIPSGDTSLQAGFDIRVFETTMRKGNWNTVNDAIPAVEALGADTIPISYTYASIPAWWPDGLEYPPYDIDDPADDSPQNIPAGYRFWNNGADPPDSPGGGGGGPPGFINSTLIPASNVGIRGNISIR